MALENRAGWSNNFRASDEHLVGLASRSPHVVMDVLWKGRPRLHKASPLLGHTVRFLCCGQAGQTAYRRHLAWCLPVVLTPQRRPAAALRGAVSNCG